VDRHVATSASVIELCRRELRRTAALFTAFTPQKPR
jgi:hypothetical protein